MDKKPKVIPFAETDVAVGITMYFRSGVYCKEFDHDYEIIQQTKLGWTAVDNKLKCRHCGDQQDQHIKFNTAEACQI